jgi:hypothetical protein
MIDISSMYEDSSRSPETFLVHMFSEVRRKKPGIIYISRIDIWWRTVQESTRILLEELLNQLQPHEPILLIATAVAQQNLESVDDYNGFERLFASGREHENIIVLEYVNIDARVAFFGQLLDDSNLSMNGIRRENGRWMLLPDEWANSRLQSGRQAIEDIPLAPSEPPKKLSMKEIRLLHEYDQSVFRRLRIVLREFLHEIIRCKDYKNLTKGLNVGLFYVMYEIANL